MIKLIEAEQLRQEMRSLAAAYARLTELDVDAYYPSRADALRRTQTLWQRFTNACTDDGESQFYSRMSAIFSGLATDVEDRWRDRQAAAATEAQETPTTDEFGMVAGPV